MANTFIFDDDDQPDMGSPQPDPGDDDTDAPEEGEEGNNRIFIMLLIGIGVLALIAVLCIGGFFLFRPGGALNSGNLAATNDFSTQQVVFAQESQTAAVATATLPPIEMTVTPTTTSVVVIFPTETSSNLEPTNDPATATFEALQTQLARAQAQTTATFTAKSTPGTRTPTPQIPKTGFADEVGLPALVIITIVLLGIILLARRLRTASAR